MNSLCSVADIFDFFTGQVLNLLQKKGIYTVIDFIRLDNRHIERISSLTYQEISEVKKHLTKSFSATPLNALKYYQKLLLNSALISTGIQELDDLLQGGFFTGTIYEICSSPCSEKTLFILAILRNVILENSIFFLDTKHEFSGKSMKVLLDKFKEKKDHLQLMNNILIKNVHTKYELISALFDIKQELEKGTSARMIIIHYLPTLFLDSNNNTENNNIINHLANILRYIAHKHHVVVIVTNLITSWIDGDFRSSKGITEKTACGKYWRSICNTRLKLIKEKSNILQVTLVKQNKVNFNSSCFININKLSV